MHENQKPTQTNEPWYIPAVPTGKSKFGALDCPVRFLGTTTNISDIIYIKSEHTEL